ncbi:aminoimidazole riboside kinase [Rosenbergiella australiborealis]|uniref:Aminoimidazole riboside kinase n=1 Tax=Rosenbergiella australiborealis TaxID=1544696 RepID=A0ABS5T505_9GAMM|nr:aminoimidazole riboside kinase [Rosenbergiella australiborealis]MBT0726555.1 aminoimidazole riboside kinase [Rosenbergiella australiborealis]
MSKKVWVLGDAVIDLLPEGEGRLLQCPGGAPANVAVGIARLGGNSAFIGRVGEDPFGRFLQNTLKKEQVSTDYMFFDPEQRTSTVVVGLDDDGERSFTFMVRPSADLFLVNQDLPGFQAEEWLHCCSIALSREPSRGTTLEAMARIRRAGGKVCFDPNIREDFWPNEHQLRETLADALTLADVIKLSEDELQFISGDYQLEQGIRSIVEAYQPELLVITRGKEGVTAYYQGEISYHEAKPVVSVDTTGAGDAFVAGLLYGLSTRGFPQSSSQLESVLALAQVCGALATTAKGAMTALPYYSEITKQF